MNVRLVSSLVVAVSIAGSSGVSGAARVTSAVPYAHAMHTLAAAQRGEGSALGDRDLTWAPMARASSNASGMPTCSQCH